MSHTLAAPPPATPISLAITSKEPQLPNSPVYRLRIEPRLKRLIDACRGNEPLSTWLRRAASERVESEHGLGSDYLVRLGEYTTQLRGLGTNLNQLAHAANEGRPVSLDRRLAQDINAAINEVRGALNEIRSRLP